MSTNVFPNNSQPCFRDKLRSLGLTMVSGAFLLAWPGCSDDTTTSRDSGVPDGPVAETGTGELGVTETGPDLPQQTYQLIILHTNDLHDHVMGWSPNADYTPATTGDDATRGGYARIAALIKKQRSEAGTDPVLVLDGGDFSMGSIFSWLNLTSTPTLSFMQELGFDAITLGNHELDWGPQGLAGELDAAVKGGFSVPIVASNIVFDASSAEDDALAAFEQNKVIVRKLVKELPNGLKVGLFGILGKGAVKVAPLAKPVTFADPVETAQAMIKELREQDKVQLVICISHTGTNQEGRGEDMDLAIKAPGIDVIISGHTHVALAQPVQEGSTLIVQSGSYGRNLGRLALEITGSTVSVKDYALLPVDDTTAGDAETQKHIDEVLIPALDTMLQPLQLTYDGVVAETDFDLSFPSYTETILGNIITDAYRELITKLDLDNPVDVAIESGGVIRDEVLKGKTGKLWFADLYGALPLGIGPDQRPGYPLVTFYLTGKEIKAGMELMAHAKDVLLNNDYFMQVSGIQVEYNTAGPLFNRVTSIKKKDGTVIDLGNTTTCYRVATNLYVGLLMGLVEDISKGLFVIKPKEKDCTTVITDITTRLVDRDPSVSGVQEFKQWQALILYLSSFPDTDANNIPNVPAAYSAPEGRIVAK